MNARIVSFLLIGLTAVFSSCAATPKLGAKQIDEVARSEGLKSVWQYSVDPGLDGDIDYFVIFYTHPSPVMDRACETRETGLGLKYVEGKFRVKDRSDGNRIAFKQCKDLQPDDFIEISDGNRRVPAQDVVQLLNAAIPGFGGSPSKLEAAAPYLKACFASATPKYLSDIVVYSNNNVSGIFYSNDGCNKRVDINIKRDEKGGINATVREALSPRTTESGRH